MELVKIIGEYWVHFKMLFFVACLLFKAPAISSQALFQLDKNKNNTLSQSYNLENRIIEECSFLNQPVVLRNEPDMLLQYWIESDRSMLNKPVLPTAPSLHEFRDQINRLMNSDPFVLLRKQRSQVSGPDSLNVNLVIKGEAGSIRKMHCLEALLLAVQTERSVDKGHSMFSNPTEFLSYVLIKDSKLKIYYYTVDQPGIGGLSIFSEFLERDIENGWKMVNNIHNHNFFPNSGQVMGGVVPSAADIQYLRNIVARFDLNGATITNGFHSIDMSQEDLKIFSTWDTEE